MFLEQIRLTNLLSFGPRTEALTLRGLNVLIGPNGSGKSNLIEAIGLLRSSPRELTVPVREGGGVRDWLWKGAAGTPVAAIEAVVCYPQGKQSLRHTLAFTAAGQRFEIDDERIENLEAYEGHQRPYFYFGYENGRPVLNVAGGGQRQLAREDIDAEKSVLAQRRDPDQYPEITSLAERYERVRIYREWSFGRYTPPRLPQKADLPTDQLAENGGNLALVLNRLRREAAVKSTLLRALRALYDGIDDFDVTVEGGTVQLFLQESGITVPATRLSDGTLRYLGLLTLLCHPSPPPLICIEEPELGLHPDVLPTIAELLQEAAKKTQLIVTTHSDILIDSLHDSPESVIVTEKQEGGTVFRRLGKDELAEWLGQYSLGTLWTRGELGGTRW